MEAFASGMSSMTSFPPEEILSLLDEDELPF
jgi:hypothetical protein